MNNRRKLVIALGAGALVAPLASFGQQQAKIFRIGFLHPSSATLSTSRVVALRSGLRDYGYVEGKNLAIEFRWADGNYERLPELAAELVRVNVDVIVTSGTPSTRAAKEATTTLPIVMTVTGDAVGSGLIASLARPGGNLTGATYFDPELTGKRFELLKEAVPRIAHLAAFVNPLNPQAMGTALQALQVVTKVKKVALEVFEARGPNEFDNAFSAMAKKRVDAVEVVDDAMFISNFKAIATLAASKRLPSTGTKEFAEAGGLIGYGVSFDATHNRAAYFIDRIFKGAKPSDLPVEQATRFELVVNLTTAKALGIKIPESILLQANKLIE